MHHENSEHEESIVTEWTFEKIVQEECTRVHKRITGHPLTDRYILVVSDIMSAVFQMTRTVECLIILVAPDRLFYVTVDNVSYIPFT